MKTGSTFIQQSLKKSASTLEASGCAVCLPTVRQLQDFSWWSEKISMATHARIQLLLVSSEFLPGIDFDPADQTNISAKHVIVVSRPLLEVYPSLYLQNLRGPRARYSTFDEFVDEKIKVDSKPKGRRPHHNFPAIVEKFENWGYDTEIIPYSKTDLLNRFIECKSFNGALDKPFAESLNRSVISQTQKVSIRSPIKSIPAHAAPAICRVNKIYAQGLLSNDERLELISTIVEGCDIRDDFELFSAKTAQKIQSLDQRINGSLR